MWLIETSRAKDNLGPRRGRPWFSPWLLRAGMVTDDCAYFVSQQHPAILFTVISPSC
jgi:hypothetical protein